MDMMRIWAISTEADVIVLSRTWLNKSVTDFDIHILVMSLGLTVPKEVEV